MFLRKLCLFATLATFAAFASITSVNRPALKSEVLPGSTLHVQFKDPKSLAAGKLLVASRNLGDPNFAETVILLVHYDDQGVLGLVLNRRTDVPLSRVFKDLAAAKDRSDPVYLGGPVETPAVFALFQSPAKIEGAEHVFGSVYWISAKTVFEQTMSARPDPHAFHVYLGYAGWNKEQLRREVELGSWFVFPADLSTVFSSDPDSLWPQMIRKTELKLAGGRSLN
jgi:putative transcriptional regulator